MTIQRLSPAENIRLQQPFDMIVIGGGINGSGIARDAAERGLDVLLLEEKDFGAGTTAYSSRLIHGGLRYFENLDFGLVAESLRERKRLLENAPHLVRALGFGIPVYEDSKRSRPLIECGMILYDLFARSIGTAHVAFHRYYGKNNFIQRFKGLKPDGLLGGFKYFDAQVNLPERLCVENVIAAKNHGAIVLNHTKVLDIQQENQKATGVRVQDLITGETFLAQGKVIVNAGGPWVDSILKSSNTTPAEPIPPKVGGTKGTHIVVKRFDDGPNQALYVEAQSNQRPYFIIPWQKDYYLIGTTDDPYKDDLDTIVSTDDEIDYLIKETNLVLPEANLTKDDVLFSYAGVRPLPYAEPGTPAGKITRNHIIFDHFREGEGMDGVISVISGKITTFRNLAEETVDYAINRFNLNLDYSRREGKPLKKSTTRKTTLPGGEEINNINKYKEIEIPNAVDDFNVSREVADHLINLYGSKFKDVLQLADENINWLKSLSQYSHDIEAQVIYAVRHEFARTTADVLMRRTGTALRENVGLDAAQRTAELMGQELGWTPEQINADAKAFTEQIIQLNRPRQSLTASATQ